MHLFILVQSKGKVLHVVIGKTDAQPVLAEEEFSVETA